MTRFTSKDSLREYLMRDGKLDIGQLVDMLWEMYQLTECTDAACSRLGGY